MVGKGHNMSFDKFPEEDYLEVDTDEFNDMKHLLVSIGELLLRMLHPR